MKMYLELIFLKIFVVVAKTQYQSPCPRTFQYEMDQNGQLVGIVGIYSFEDNVELNVQLSVGNHVQNYNGHIELDVPRDQVLRNIRNNQPVRYKVFFPRWENIPPRVTKITVNGQEVCTGPPLEFNRYIRVVTSITLQHRFIKVQPLRTPDNNIGNINSPPFFIPKETGGKNNNPFLNGGSLDDGKDVYFTTTTPKPTTIRTTSKPVAANDLLFADNPFLNGRASIPPPSPTTRRPSSSSITCGMPVVANPLILNGKSVRRGAFPWLTAIYASTGTGVEYTCSGSLVSKKHVVTAAHCVQKDRTKIPVNKLLFILGKLNIENVLIGEGEEMVGAEDVKIHPDYVPLTSDADLAVVTLSKEIVFTNYIRPICLWNEPDDIDTIVNEKGKVVGWGRDENNNSMTAEPRQATLPIVSQDQCVRSSEVFQYVTSPRTFCAGDRNNYGPCNGDSGSGFIMKRKDRWFLRGVVSISTYDSVKQTCDLSNYVVFTDVSKFKKWLLSIIVI